MGDLHEIDEDRHTEKGDPLRIIHCDTLWDEFTDYDREIRDPTDRDKERKSLRIRSNERDCFDDVLE